MLIKRPADLAAWFRSPVGVAVNALGMTQIIGWGTTIYALAVLGGPIVSDTGWDRTVVFGGLTLGLLVSGAFSSWCGGLIDRRGARGVMSIGAVLNAVGLAAWAWSSSPWAYFAAWALLGVAMRLTLYDAAFAALVQIAPANGRRAIALLTLWGGFASTVFWPVGAALEAWLGWRATCLVFALLNLAVCLPLHWWGLAGREPATARSSATPSTAPPTTERRVTLGARDRPMAMTLLAISTSAYAFIFGAASVHLVALIEASGVALTTAVAIAACKGVAQVAGRLWEILFASRMPAIRLARVPVWLMPAAFVVLIALAGGPLPALVFTLAFGAANGLITIVRGALPLALFGSDGYGRILGVLATPYLMINALAPLAFAVIIERWGYLAGQWLLLAIALLSLVAMEILIAWYERRPERSTS